MKLINADAVVLDLRSSEAFARGHIVNAKNIPSDELTDNQEKYSKDKRGIDYFQDNFRVEIFENGTADPSGWRRTCRPHPRSTAARRR